jgi:hypothetical protein
VATAAFGRPAKRSEPNYKPQPGPAVVKDNNHEGHELSLRTHRLPSCAFVTFVVVAFLPILAICVPTILMV